MGGPDCGTGIGRIVQGRPLWPPEENCAPMKYKGGHKARPCKLHSSACPLQRDSPPSQGRVDESRRLDISRVVVIPKRIQCPIGTELRESADRGAAHVAIV